MFTKKNNFKKSDFPIGIIDSGVGGLSIFKSLREDLSNESLVYFGDSYNCPYGNKSKTEIRKYLYDICKYLISNYYVKLIILACNTATVSGIQFLRNYFTIPFIGLVPVIKSASLMSRKKKIACMATRNTINSEIQLKLIDDFAKKNHVEVYSICCDGLVEIIEKKDDLNLFFQLQKYLNPLNNIGADILVLGCTHYTLIKPQIIKLIPDNIQVLDSTKPVIRQVIRILNDRKLLSFRESSKATYNYITNSRFNHFTEIAHSFLGNLFSRTDQLLIREF